MRSREPSASDRWFVGRVSELAAIGTCVDAVSGGAGRVVWVEGDPGSGKTALVNHVVAELPTSFVVVRAAADESTADQPFALLEQFGIEGGGSAQAAGLDLVTLSTEAGGGGPVAVVVEDLHCADRESRQALSTVARRVGDERVLLVVTSRPGAAPDGWERLFLDPSGGLRVVLGALSRDDVAEMARVAGLALSCTGQRCTPISLRPGAGSCTGPRQNPSTRPLPCGTGWPPRRSVTSAPCITPRAAARKLSTPQPGCWR